ncbi:hypothetical protein [Actinomadura kijaniata]|uniref:hypothetical protein n=1 Tax=Actinomadura kijaniata TaxID=46161 RepID=UPI00082B5422|nr:hypothetical protein [Actinomadura kijaniata]
MTPTPPREIWISGETCAALVEEAIREALTGRFFKVTVKDAVRVGQRKAEELLVDYDRADDEPGHHRGLAKLDCPIECLGLTAHACNRLKAGRGLWPDDAPQTVADVLKLVKADRLRDITGIGQTHAREITSALRRNGHPTCPNDDHDHTRPPSPKTQEQLAPDS